MAPDTLTQCSCTPRLQRPFYKATITWNGNGWTLRLEDGTEVRFPESHNAKNLAQGAAFELMDAAGDKLQFDRDRQRNLREILTPNGRSIRFGYDDQARIIRARDDNADSVRYGYNQDGMLIYAAQSSGAARVYQYQGSLMTAVMDERGRTLVRNWYDDSKILIAQVFANGDVYWYRYEWSPNNHFAEKVVVTLPDHSEKEISPAETVPDYIRSYREATSH